MQEEVVEAAAEVAAAEVAAEVAAEAAEAAAEVVHGSVEDLAILALTILTTLALSSS